MRPLIFAMFLLLAGGLWADDFPSRPFSFVGVPQQVREGSYHTIDGEVQSLVVKIIKVKRGAYDKPEIGFDFKAGTKPPLEIGEAYLFEAVYDRHGIRYTHWEKLKKKPNQALEPTSTAVTPPAIAGDRASDIRGSP